MIRIDDSLLEELGLLVLPKEERDKLLKQIYETLEMRVGMRLAERMSDHQLDEFERFIDTNDEAGALKWLETNFPDYKQVVADELEKLKVEIKKDSPQIVAAMQAQAGATETPQTEEPTASLPAQQFGVPAPNPEATMQLPQNPTVVPQNFNQTPPSQPAGYQNIPPPPSDQSQQPPQAA